jgi:hypothetical protein
MSSWEKIFLVLLKAKYDKINTFMIVAAGSRLLAEKENQ